MSQDRELLFYKDYFRNFYTKLSIKVQKKILWTLRILENFEHIPSIYFKYLEDTDGLYEIRVQSDGNIFRIFCFFDEGNIIVIGHGFQKKTQKTPYNEISKAQQIKQQYFEDKKSDES